MNDQGGISGHHRVLQSQPVGGKGRPYAGRNQDILLAFRRVRLGARGSSMAGAAGAVEFGDKSHNQGDLALFSNSVRAMAVRKKTPVN